VHLEAQKQEIVGWCWNRPAISVRLPHESLH